LFFGASGLDNGEHYNLNDYCKPLGDISCLYRGLKSSSRHPGYVMNLDYFSPRRGSLNRFNPPNKNYIYLGFSRIKSCLKRLPNVNIFNASEYTCLKEIQAIIDVNRKISLQRFVSVGRKKKLKLLDFSFFEYRNDNKALQNILDRMLIKYTTFKTNQPKMQQQIKEMIKRGSTREEIEKNF
jgi:hypothetical protein